MNVAILSCRFPWPPYTGDRLRAAVWVEALRGVCDVTLIAPAGDLPSEARFVRHIQVGLSLRATSRAAIRAVTTLPLHSIAAGRYDWQRSLSSEDAFDVAVVLLTRLHPFVDGQLRVRRRVLDAVDSSTRSMAERARAASPALRPLWRLESRRARVLEEGVVGRYDHVLVVSETERGPFLGQAEILPTGVESVPEDGAPARTFDFGFWGRLAYFANRDAAERLRHDIWPGIRRAMPQATLLIAGADAPSSILAWNGRDGITVVSPMVDRALMQRVRVAVFPVRFGTGQANKVLEAAAASCAIIASPEIMTSMPELIPLCRCAAGNEAVIAEAVALGRDSTLAQQLGEDLRVIVERCYPRARTLERMRELVGANQPAR